MNSNLLLKLGAISSSVLLAAVFISYRAGVFGWLTESSPSLNSGLSGDVRELEVAPDGARIFYSSKGGPVYVDSQTSPAVNGMAGSDRNTISSSKYGAVFLSPEPPRTAPAQPSPQTTVDASVLIGGSKSLQMLPPAPPSGNVVPEAERANQPVGSVQ